MKKFYFLIYLPPLFILSCKSIRQKPFQLVKISTDKGIDIVAIGSDSADNSVRYAGGYLIVRRSLHPLPIKLKIADTLKTVFLRPGRWPIGIFAPGLLAFPGRVFIGKEDSSVYLSRYRQERKGRWRYYLAPSFINNFNLHSPFGQYSHNVGVLGFESGFDYFTQHNQYYSVFIGIATDVLPLPIEYFGQYFKENGGGIYAGIRKNYVLGRFDLGYGMSFNFLKYKYESLDSIYHSAVINSIGMGASLIAQFRLNNVIRFGVTYQPSIIDFKAAPLINYQHFLSVNATIKMPERRSHKRQRK